MCTDGPDVVLGRRNAGKLSRWDAYLKVQSYFNDAEGCPALNVAGAARAWSRACWVAPPTCSTLWAAVSGAGLGRSWQWGCSEYGWRRKNACSRCAADCIASSTPLACSAMGAKYQCAAL